MHSTFALNSLNFGLIRVHIEVMKFYNSVTDGFHMITNLFVPSVSLFLSLNSL